MIDVIEEGAIDLQIRNVKQNRNNMKSFRSTWIMVAAVLILSSSLQTLAQETTLGPIVVTASNYKYLNAVNPEDVAQPVNMMEQYAAAFDIKSAEFYDDIYDNYIVSFYIPEGKILAAYDKEGRLLRTAERYKSVAIPKQISQAVAKRFPNWGITKDVYLVNYYTENPPYSHSTKKVYKLMLENGNKRMRVKLDDAGEFL